MNRSPVRVRLSAPRITSGASERCTARDFFVPGGLVLPVGGAVVRATWSENAGAAFRRTAALYDLFSFISSFRGGSRGPYFTRGRLSPKQCQKARRPCATHSKQE